MLRPVYTEPENCQDCYKCIRECPVKAIRVEGNKASIIDERCIFCGHCTQVCPTGAKKVRDGLTRAKYTLARHPGRVYMSLAPSYLSEFGDVSPERLAGAIRRLGVAGVSETALGAEAVSRETERLLAGGAGQIFISSSCPVAVDYIRKYAPSFTGNITPVVSPMVAHAAMLKSLYGDDIRVVFAGPCVGKKSEADNFPDLVDVAITFRDLRSWFDEEGIDPTLPEPPGAENRSDFVPRRATYGSLYPIDGGMLAGMARADGVQYMSFSGLDSIKDVLDGLDAGALKQPVFLELLACRGGCVNGPAKLRHLSAAQKRHNVIEKAAKTSPEPPAVVPDGSLYLTADFAPDPQNQTRNYSEQEIKEALESVGKTGPKDELNCSGCGYDSCRDFAAAMLDGNAEPNMCASYMRKIAHDKATVLLQKIPAGVVLVNSDLKIVDMNRHFAAYMGDEVSAVYDVVPGMAGSDIDRVCDFGQFFRTALATGEELLERRIASGGKTWLLSIYNIQKYRQVFGLLQNMREPAVQQDWILEKTREVIRNHMTTVQNVAGLLGENAAFTDATLRSIISAFDNAKGDEKRPQNNSSATK